ncbi:hypothetical protein BH24ACT15_BH24ACT15_34980 [soil metagenome]
MATWRVARSLDTLLGQINETAPNRSKISDGSIGDQAHSSRASDHNPDPRGIVHARDYTHDPGRGADMNTIMSSLAASADYRIKYCIWNRRITQWQGGRLVWFPYYGSNPHDKHGHVSVNIAGEDDTRPWNISGNIQEDEMTPDQARQLKWVYDRLVGMTGVDHPQYVVEGGVARQVSAGTPGALPVKLLTTLDGNYLITAINSQSKPVP